MQERGAAAVPVKEEIKEELVEPSESPRESPHKKQRATDDPYMWSVEGKMCNESQFQSTNPSRDLYARRAFSADITTNRRYAHIWVEVWLKFQWNFNSPKTTTARTFNWSFNSWRSWSFNSIQQFPETSSKFTFSESWNFKCCTVKPTWNFTPTRVEIALKRQCNFNYIV